MSTDFQDRTVLSMITDNEYEELLADFKISALLDQLWKGKESSNCNGKTINFSLLTHMSQSSVRRLVGQSISQDQVLERDFVNNIDKSIESEDFSFQYSFRKSSIAQIFNKELISTVIFLFCLIYINIEYSLVFDYNNFNPFTESIKLFTKLEKDEVYWKAVAFDCYKNETAAAPINLVAVEIHKFAHKECL